MIRRHELTDQEWELLAPLIPRAATGRPRVSDRQVINGMVYKIRTGISWRDLPERYGPWKTVYTRFRRYALDGVFTRALQQIQAHVDAAGEFVHVVGEVVIHDPGVDDERAVPAGADGRCWEGGAEAFAFLGLVPGAEAGVVAVDDDLAVEVVAASVVARGHQGRRDNP
ncbi:transposase [Streptomyces achromogenes]|uniref:transposase n=1 Tax=Streptomyces achromogenes TaxID=67255 RepID=UPI0033F74B43